MSATVASTPASDGFHMPGEFRAHSGCWMAWPERGDFWRLQAGPAQEAFVEVAAAINVSEPVTVGVSDHLFERCRAALAPAIQVVELSTDDAWMRDTGPTFVVDDHGRRRGVHWHFNAWGGLDGGLYSPWDRDERVAAKVLELEHADRYRAPLVLEGGSIHCDGEGTVLTTEECLLNPNRNPALARHEIERLLLEYLGAERVLWLGRGLPRRRDRRPRRQRRVLRLARPRPAELGRGPGGSDDRGLARCAGPPGRCRRRPRAADRDRPDPLARTALPGGGRGLGPAAAPGVRPRRAGERLPASYVNFYPATSRIVYPLLDERYDEQAAEVLSACFPGREVVGIPSREILLGGGNIHCITQQVPAGTGTAGATAGVSAAPGSA